MYTMKVKSYCIKIEVVFGNTLKVYSTIRVHGQPTYAYILAISNYVQIAIHLQATEYMTSAVWYT